MEDVKIRRVHETPNDKLAKMGIKYIGSALKLSLKVSTKFIHRSFNSKVALNAE